MSNQQEDADSVLAAYQIFLKWRREQECLRKGEIRFIDAPDTVLAFERSLGSERLVCCFNLSDEVVSLEMNGVLLVEGHGFDLPEVEDGKLILAPYAAVFGKAEGEGV